jgi:hypothetical protein
MQTTGIKRSLKILWIAGVVVLATTISILLWRQGHADSYAQASFISSRLMFVSSVTVFWAIAPAIWRARHNKIARRTV